MCQEHIVELELSFQTSCRPHTPLTEMLLNSEPQSFEFEVSLQHVTYHKKVIYTDSREVGVYRRS